MMIPTVAISGECIVQGRALAHKQAKTFLHAHF